MFRDSSRHSIITTSPDQMQLSDIFISRNVWRTFTESEMAEYIETVLTHYRKAGFPYFPSDMAYRRNELRKFIKSDISDIVDGDTIRQTMAGLAFCWSYMPHAYGVRCNGMRTPLDVFNDDSLLRQVIAKRTMMGDNMSDNGLRKMLKIFSGTQCVSNFRPTAAGAFYNIYGKNRVVWDMSFGYGGRMLGAMKAGVKKYIGSDPCVENYNGLKRMIGDFPNFFVPDRIELHNCGSETLVLDNGSVDLCFTSPPYFNTEMYSDDETQSYVKFPTREEWLNGFLGKTIDNCKHCLKDDGILAINIANVRSYPNLESDTVRMIKGKGFRLIGTMKYALSSLKHNDKFKHEPIFVFDRGKGYTTARQLKLF